MSEKKSGEGPRYPQLDVNLFSANGLRAVQEFGLIEGPQYNVSMYWIILCLIMLIITDGPSLSLAIGEEPPHQPSAKERLQQVLDAEGGTTVYMDAAGNVHSSQNLPNGEQIIRVQPPQIPGLNLGPPLQLNNRPLQLPPPPPVPASPPPPDFPQRAR